MRPRVGCGPRKCIAKKKHQMNTHKTHVLLGPTNPNPCLLIKRNDRSVICGADDISLRLQTLLRAVFLGAQTCSSVSLARAREPLDRNDECDRR